MYEYIVTLILDYHHISANYVCYHGNLTTISVAIKEQPTFDVKGSVYYLVATGG